MWRLALRGSGVATRMVVTWPGGRAAPAGSVGRIGCLVAAGVYGPCSADRRSRLWIRFVLRRPVQLCVHAEDRARDHLRDRLRDQWLRLALRTLAACRYRWSSGSGGSACMRAFPSARRMRSRRWPLPAGSRSPGRCTTPWSGCSMSRAVKALSPSPGAWPRRACPNPWAIRSRRWLRRWTFGFPKRTRDLGSRFLRTVSACMCPLSFRSAIGLPSRRRSSRLRPSAGSREIRTRCRNARRRMIAKAIVQAGWNRGSRLHRELPLALIRRLRLPADPVSARIRDPPAAPMSGAGAARRSAAAG